MTERTHNKTKEELEHEMELRKEEKRQRSLVKDVLYPYLLEHSRSIDDAKNMCYAAQLAVQSTFHEVIAKEQRRVSMELLDALKLGENLQQGEEYKRDRDFIDLLKNERVATAETLLVGLKKVIESFEKEESTKRSLSDLPADLLE